ncbi:hypothetical protein VNI00_001015 [Paramarasmius palmivorus]|uniref:Uncharacterized protein n=1 Tax=Paramarasmius palmivorus TaxID=297713 RepID=A0AAW0E7N5_9AGAR
MNLSLLLNPSAPTSPSRPSRNSSDPEHELQLMDAPSRVQYSVYLNSQTTLITLYHYPPNVRGIPYPQTHASGSIGHLFRIDPENPCNPLNNMAYSHGGNKGSRYGVKVAVLTDGQGALVPCTKTTTTCRGCKKCPFVDVQQISQAHVSVEEQGYPHYTAVERDLAACTPEREVFEATLGLFATFRDRGCFAPLQQPTYYTEAEARVLEDVRRTPTKAKRGATIKETCKGRLLLIQQPDGVKVQYEHCFIAHTSRFISAGRYHLSYLTALFNEDGPTIAQYEEAMKVNGYGPLVPCNTVRNFRAVKTNCDLHHRDSDGRLVMQEMKDHPCDSKFIVYEPDEEYRQACPYILVVCRYPHTHPPPILSKTPFHIRNSVLEFLGTLEDLPNLTARRLLRSDVALQYLRGLLPQIPRPTFVDLHVSFNNRDHLQSLIDQAQQSLYPMGTGWEGAKYLKEQEDLLLPPEKRYIRSIQEHRLVGVDDLDEPLRFVICIKSQNSHRLLTSARHIQSDIAFKRVVHWYEFEITGFDRSLQATVCYVRCYINSQSAEAHCILLLQIHRIVLEDTGRSLQFRHLHSSAQNDPNFQGILSWTVDHHAGQGKGIGLYMQHIAPHDKFDLHEPGRLLTELGPYDHLKRILRLCVAHYYRKIQEGHYEPAIGQAMRSLACFRHQSWDQTIATIEQGDQKAKNWLVHKQNLKFAFPALCWEKSFIPAPVWQASEATSNIVESSHWDILIDTGRDCTLVGGIIRAQKYDNMQDQTNQTMENTGIPRRYRQVNPTNREYNSMRRHTNSRVQQLQSQDQLIEGINNALKKARDAVLRAQARLAQAEEMQSRGGTDNQAVQRAAQQKQKAMRQWEKARTTSENARQGGMGSGSVAVEMYEI